MRFCADRSLKKKLTVLSASPLPSLWLCSLQTALRGLSLSRSSRLRAGLHPRRKSLRLLLPQRSKSKHFYQNNAGSGIKLYAQSNLENNKQNNKLTKGAHAPQQVLARALTVFKPSPLRSMVHPVANVCRNLLAFLLRKARQRWGASPSEYPRVNLRHASRHYFLARHQIFRSLSPGVDYRVQMYSVSPLFSTKRSLHRCVLWRIKPSADDCLSLTKLLTLAPAQPQTLPLLFYRAFAHWQASQLHQFSPRPLALVEAKLTTTFELHFRAKREAVYAQLLGWENTVWHASRRCEALLVLSTSLVVASLGLSRRMRFLPLGRTLFYQLLRRYLVILTPLALGVKVFGAVPFFTAAWRRISRPTNEIFQHPLTGEACADLSLPLAPWTSAREVQSQVQALTTDDTRIDPALPQEKLSPLQAVLTSWFLDRQAVLQTSQLTKIWRYSIEWKQLSFAHPRPHGYVKMRRARGIKRRRAKQIVAQTHRRFWFF